MYLQTYIVKNRTEMSEVIRKIFIYDASLFISLGLICKHLIQYTNKYIWQGYTHGLCDLS